MMQRKLNKAGPFGRAARGGLGLCLAVITLPVYFDADSSYVSASLTLTVGLAVLYVALYALVSRYLAAVSGWVLAVLPVVLVWSFGQGGWPLFGSGEGGTAALTYLMLSLFVDFIRGSAGCEVMAIPSLLFGTGTHVPCVLLCPIDHAEADQRRA